MKLYCVECNKEIDARLTDGSEIYPSREDLYHLHFYKCDNCGNYVGCHKGTLRPLGCIPTYQIRQMRTYIHNIIDPLWKNNVMSRNRMYKVLSRKLGYDYHSGEIKSLEEANKVYRVAQDLVKEVTNES